MQVIQSEKERSSFVAEITEQAVKFEEVAQLEEAQIVSMETYIDEQQLYMTEMQKKLVVFGNLAGQKLVGG